MKSVGVQSGPDMLQYAAKDYVSSWQVNHTSDGQVCRVEIVFVMLSDTCESRPSTVHMINLQHFEVAANPALNCIDTVTSDPIRIRHSLLFFHWYTKAS